MPQMSRDSNEFLWDSYFQTLGASREANLVRVLGETTITTRVARILDYIKEKIKIQLPLVNLQGIKLTVGWSIM